MKKLIFLGVVVLMALFPSPQRRLVDLISGGPAPGFAVAWPAARYVLEPFAGAAEYFLSFTRYMVQLSSWMFWLLLLAFAAGFYKKERRTAMFLRALRFELIFLSAVVLCLILPFSAPRLNAPENFRLVDFHSHTFYSHDGLVSPEQSLLYHRNLGFDSFFVTEHGHTASFAWFPATEQLNTVFPGMQVSTTERVSLLILAGRPFDGAPYLHKSVKDVIELAHRDGFVAVCPHWWKWRYFSWEQLYEYGIDGFEVYNAGYRKFSPEERQSLIAFCKEKKLLALGSTDWHGWGYMSNVWTALERTGDMKTLPFDALKRHSHTSVLVLERPNEIQNTFRYVFEPFFGAYYYFGSFTFRQAAAWALWAALLALIFMNPFLRGLSGFLPAVLAAVFVLLCAWSLILWVPLLPENQILGKLLAPVFLGLAAGWLIVYKFRNKTTAP